MKVLFVCSGNKNNFISPIIQAQANSLIKVGIKVDIFPVTGKGILGYLGNMWKLNAAIRRDKYTIIHAHYGMSGILAFLLKKNTRLIVSLMGSEVYHSRLWLKVFRFFSIYCWDETIVKTRAMYKLLKCKDAYIIPNGVNLDVFYPMCKEKARGILNFELEKPMILFPSNALRKEKNSSLAQSACKSLDLNLIWLDNVPHEKVNLYYNAADIILMTSFFEGSPNAIKEAMAANRPIISTKVGDIEEYFNDTIGCFICDFNEFDISLKISHILKNLQNSEGLKRLLELKFDDMSIAEKIKHIYASQ